MIECSKCGEPIPGEYIPDDTTGYVPSRFEPPAYCRKCSHPFPWTEARLEAARALAFETEELSNEERQLLVGTLDDLVNDTPRTQLAIVRFKKLMAKAGRSTASAFRDILVDVLSETAKRSIWGP